MTEKGSMTYQVFVKWIGDFNQYKPPGPTLLIFDRTKFHLDISIVDKAILQKPAAYFFWEEDPGKPNRNLTKENLPRVFSSIWSKCMTLTNIAIGVRATGIWPITYRAQTLKMNILGKDYFQTLDLNNYSCGFTRLCGVCHVDCVTDMQARRSCNTWVHHECVGLTVDDDENFICPEYD
ncbi:hypothetical protein PR048_013841, partial [Dryococelus australis]